ncbi:MAG: hypothetical protein ACRC5A_04930 [Enterobacteriaceae bacterium]
MSDERIDYQEIRSSFLDCYYYYCRNVLNSMNKNGRGWEENEHEIGYAYDQFENSYELPIENLMLHVLNLILSANRFGKTFEDYHRTQIANILSVHSLDELIADISEDEKNDLLYDMKLLKII